MNLEASFLDTQILAQTNALISYDSRLTALACRLSEVCFHQSRFQHLRCRSGMNSSTLFENFIVTSSPDRWAACRLQPEVISIYTKYISFLEIMPFNHKSSKLRLHRYILKIWLPWRRLLPVAVMVWLNVPWIRPSSDI